MNNGFDVERQLSIPSEQTHVVRDNMESNKIRKKRKSSLF